MYNGNLREQARREKEDLEKQINQLISDYEAKWKQNWIQLSLLAIPETKNNLPYNRQKGG
ncbi:hypothetical protein [Pedobacter sp. MC2016-24]|uniref:hypothetical protein n=1 Tax=Pedobacter sp. MC2016-24 TaxID=2780090 RepID=UPI001882F47C|nr:hypothetical protein [Pedobacter sp. MC2016-24]MBE9598448.1 hypothetical protein [Pedobacter sp. MC2016-24]